MDSQEAKRLAKGKPVPETPAKPAKDSTRLSLGQVSQPGTKAAPDGLQCFDRFADGHEDTPPAHLVVFDCDETLTLSTFLPKERELRIHIGYAVEEWGEYLSGVNFQSPFIKANRLEKLRELLAKLKEPGPDGIKRVLAVLTRNNAGAIACLNLLMMAKLAEFFDVIWCMHHSSDWEHGVYNSELGWKVFNPPLKRIHDHKADALYDVAANPDDWFPQLKVRPDLDILHTLKPQNIVLIDDDVANFKSTSESQHQVLRFCKVARYDSEFNGMGMISGMGGIGARNEEDFKVLDTFVRQPSAFKKRNKENLRCKEHLAGA